MAAETHDLIIAEDSEIVRNLLVRLATARGFKPVAEERGDDAMRRVHDGVKAVVIDLRMPGWDGFQCLEWLAREHPDLPAVVLSGADEASEAVRAMKLGAVDYVTKPFDAEELFTVLRKAVQLRELKRENQALREEYEMPAGALSDDPVGASEVMKALFRRASQAAPLDSNILLTGESGTGKGVLARHIHARSDRARGPFITVSCPTLPRELLESELFGHEKGAFTGAMRKRAGKIELAHGGTLFLDEIGDMPLDLQPKLLNVLQDREYQRVGGETTLKADVRVIAATHVDLRDAVKNGAFREDLYYRLGVLTLEVPPLRERDGDIRALVEHVLSGIARRRKHEGYRIDAAALDRLSGYTWPGNVRQLENVMEQATAFCEAGRVTLSDLPAEIRSEARTGPRGVPGLAGLSLDILEREALIQTLELAGNNKAETARLLGISEKSVYNMLRRHQLKY